MKASKIFSAIFLTIFLTGCSAPKTENYDTSFFAMDTYITISAAGGNAENAVKSAQKRIEELEEKWSVTNESSEIYAINHSNGTEISVSDDTENLVGFALEMSQKTNGALDPTLYPIISEWGFTTGDNHVPSNEKISELLKSVDYSKVHIRDSKISLNKDMMIDLGAVGKGFAGDEAAKILRENGIGSALINLGGNVQTIGSKEDGSPWKLGLRNPFDAGNIGVLSVTNSAVVTSGNYERYFVEDGKIYGHIIDPKTGYPVQNDCVSVTIIASDGRLCDALSTALFVMGKDKAIEFWKENGNFDFIIISSDGELFITENAAENFTLGSDYSNMKLNVIGDE